MPNANSVELFYVRLISLPLLGLPYQSELGEIRPLVHVAAPALCYDLVEVRMAVGWPLQPVSVAHAPHHLTGAHAGVRGGAYKRDRFRLYNDWHV